MKTKRSIIAVILTLCLLGSAGCSGGSKTTELKLAHFWPAGHPIETDLVQPWAAEIERVTQGRVKITSYPGETLAQANAIYEGVKKGIADIGVSCFAYTRGQFPILEVFELPGVIYNSSDAASKIAWEGIQMLNPKEIQDTTLMMVFTTGPGNLFTKTPVRELSDLKGMEIRATGLSAATLKALGAAPVAMSQAEAYEALSKGVVRGNMGPTEILKDWGQAEVTDYITLTPFLYNTLFFVTMKTDKWDSISKEDQQSILGVNDKFFFEVACGLWDRNNEKAYNYAVVEKGLEVIELSDAEKELWISLVKPVQDEYVAKMDELGFPGREILDSIIKLSEQYK